MGVGLGGGEDRRVTEAVDAAYALTSPDALQVVRVPWEEAQGRWQGGPSSPEAEG